MEHSLKVGGNGVVCNCRVPRVWVTDGGKLRLKIDQSSRVFSESRLNVGHEYA
jgi:hypothetical protein